MESFAGDTNDRERHAIQDHDPRHDARVALEPLLPELVTEHGHRVRPRGAIFLGEEETT